MIAREHKLLFLFSDALCVPRPNFGCRLRAGKSPLLHPTTNSDDGLCSSARHGGRYDPIRAQQKMKQVAALALQLARCSSPAGGSGEVKLEAELRGEEEVVGVLKRSLLRSGCQTCQTFVALDQFVRAAGDGKLTWQGPSSSTTEAPAGAEGLRHVCRGSDYLHVWLPLGQSEGGDGGGRGDVCRSAFAIVLVLVVNERITRMVQSRKRVAGGYGIDVLASFQLDCCVQSRRAKEMEVTTTLPLVRAP
eukprot:758501-Hanusia_phi.AAC.1